MARPKIAILDDYKFWCVAVKRFFRSQFDVDDYADMSNLIKNIHSYNLVMVDFAIAHFDKLEKFSNGRELVQHIKATVEQPPIMMLISGFISKNDMEKAVEMCPEADGFWAKDAGLDSLLKQVKSLIFIKAGEVVDN